MLFILCAFNQNNQIMKNKSMGWLCHRFFNLKILSSLLLLFALTAYCNVSKASHIIGGELSYTHVVGNVYKVRLAIYRDCDGVSLPTSVPIRSQTLSNASIGTVTRISVTDISILCPGQTSSCVSPSSPTPGIEEHIYEGNMTIAPTPGGKNTIYYSQCCRPAGITTLTSSSSQGITLSTTVNTATAVPNNSPVFLNPPTGQYCIGQLASLSLNGFDPDGDVIRYRLVNAFGSNFTPISYAAGFSGAVPLSSSTPITIDSVTGVINFTPNSIERGIVTIEAAEFRGGIEIGSVRRDIEVVSISCASNTIPTITPIASSILHVGNTLCLPVAVTDADGDSLIVTANGAIIPPAIFTIDSAMLGATYGTFCFTPQLSDTGNTFSISINAQDDNCPAPGTAVTTFNITVPRPCNVSTSTTVTPTTCGLSTGTASATLNNGVGPYSYVWTGPGTFSASTSSISNLAAGFYYVSIIDGNNCVGEDTVEVLSSSPLSLTGSVQDIDCNNATGSIMVTVMGGTAPYMYSLNGGTAQGGSNFSGLADGAYGVTVTDSNGCMEIDSFTITTILDVMPPVASCKNITLTLTSSSDSITAMDIDNGSSDNCGITSMLVYPNVFGCADAGPNTVTLVVMDAAGNSDTCTSVVTVDQGNVITIANCPANINKNCIGGPGKKAYWNPPTATLNGPCTTPCIGGDAIPGFTYKGTHNGHSYYVSNSSNYRWTQAQSAAIGAGGYLVSINDAAENAFVKSIIPNNCPGGEVWIGYNDVATEGTFDWTNGDSTTYTNWKPGEPNNNGYNCSRHCHNHHGADYVLMRKNNGQWYDRRNCEKNNFVLEIPCQNPVTVVQVAGPNSGSTFAGGTTTQITYAAYTANGDTTYCNFNVTIAECTPAYCAPPNYNSYYEHIDRVELNTLDNISGNDGGFGNYVNVNTTLSKGMTYPITLTPGFKNCRYREYWKVWIDWNYDGDFSDAGEMVAFGKSKFAITKNINVPNSATTGKSLRMRVIMKWGGYPTSPCAANCYGWGARYGEVEDYSIMVTGTNKTATIVQKIESIDDEEPMTQNPIELARLYPNPISASQGEITVDYRVLKEGDVTISIQTIDGKILSREVVASKEGANRVGVKLPAIAAGLYTLIVSNKDGKHLQKFSVR